MSQNTLAEPTSGTLSGLSLVQNLNNALDTLNTLASGASAPATPEVGQFWHDTGNNLLKMRSEDNTAWITLGTLDETNHLFTAMAAASAATAAVASALSGVLGIGNGGTASNGPVGAFENLLSGFTSGLVPQSLGGTGAGSLTTALTAYFQDSFGGNGYRRNVMDSFMLQWEVTGAIGAGGGASVYWPTSFPNACLFAVAGRYIGDASAGGANVYGWTKNAVSVYNAGPSNAQIAILAIGY